MSASLDDVNDAFHEAYDDAEEASRSEAPVLVLLEDDLVLHRGDQKDRHFSAVPREFHALKSAVHAPVAAFAMLHDSVDRSCSTEVTAHLEKLRALGVAAKDEVDDADCIAILRDTATFLDRVIANRRVTRQELYDFARSCGPRIEAMMDRAAKLELDRLHASAEEILAQFSDDERATFQVVVAGHHQARDRSLGMQYFRKRLDEKAGAEDRVIYAEGVSSIEDALALLGKKRVDRDLASAFFGDEKRMQRDLLGDAAERILNAANLPRIGR